MKNKRLIILCGVRRFCPLKVPQFGLRGPDDFIQLQNQPLYRQFFVLKNRYLVQVDTHGFETTDLTKPAQALATVQSENEVFVSAKVVGDRLIVASVTSLSIYSLKDSEHPVLLGKTSLPETGSGLPEIVDLGEGYLALVSAVDMRVDVYSLND